MKARVQEALSDLSCTNVGAPLTSLRAATNLSTLYRFFERLDARRSGVLGFARKARRNELWSRELRAREGAESCERDTRSSCVTLSTPEEIADCSADRQHQQRGRGGVLSPSFVW